MHLREELEARGLLYQTTNEAFFDLYDQGGEKFYCGYDPTADSLHLGHFLTFMAAVNFMKRGNTFVMLIGGATGMIGDPTGKSEARAFLGLDQLRHNQEAITEQVGQILENLKKLTGKDFQFKVVNNYDFYKDLSVFDWYRTVGKYITLNTMLSKESVKKRLENTESGISYTEFSYMLLQGNDFVHLYENEGVKLQIGGSDQRGNMVTGTEMLRKKTEGEAESYVMTIPLMMDASGKKFGKSEGNAIWLDQRKNSPYFVYQYFLNSADADVEKFLRAFTLLEIAEIEEIVAKHNEKPESRYGQRQLANYVIQTLFGKQAAEQAEKITDFLFGSEDKMQMINEFSREEIQALARETGSCEISENEIRVLELLVKCGIVDSNGEAKKMIAQGAIYVNENKISDIASSFSTQDASNGVLLIRKGKKNYKIAQFID
ncbi:tyrosine--tRNA ligase [Candidatus Gracilibacteria bacterium]|nr:tyrosine--tRNA ligase [Candidatus Gracilibacteria bacterium]